MPGVKLALTEKTKFMLNCDIDMLTPCSTSHLDGGLMGYVETEANAEIRVPANSKFKARIIRQLSDKKYEVQCLWSF